MLTPVRYSGDGISIVLPSSIVDGLILQLNIENGELTPALCTRTITDYGLTMYQFGQLLHLNGLRVMIAQYPEAFLILGQNRYVLTELTDKPILISEN